MSKLGNSQTSPWKLDSITTIYANYVPLIKPAYFAFYEHWYTSVIFQFIFYIVSARCLLSWDSTHYFHYALLVLSNWYKIEPSVVGFVINTTASNHHSSILIERRFKTVQNFKNDKILFQFMFLAWLVKHPWC